MDKYINEVAGETEVVISVPVSLVKELDSVAPGEIAPASANPPEFSLAALGRQSRVFCDKKASRQSVKLLKIVSSG